MKNIVYVADSKSAATLASFIWSETDRRPQNFTDMEFVCKDGSIRAHSLYLKPSCPFIKELVKDSSIPKEEDLVIMVPDFRLETVNLFLEFIYTGKAVLNPSNFEKMKIFGFKQLGFFMMLNWNIKLEKLPIQNYNVGSKLEVTTTTDINTADSYSDSLNEYSFVDSKPEQKCSQKQFQTCVQQPHQTCVHQPHQTCVHQPHQTFVHQPHQTCVQQPHQTCAERQLQTCLKSQFDATTDTTIDLDESHFIEDKPFVNKNDPRELHSQQACTQKYYPPCGRSLFNATCDTTIDLDESHFIEDKPSLKSNDYKANMLAAIQKQQNEHDTTSASDVSHYIFQKTILNLDKNRGQENKRVAYPNETLTRDDYNVTALSDVSHFVSPKAFSKKSTLQVLAQIVPSKNLNYPNADTGNNVSSISDISCFVEPTATVKQGSKLKRKLSVVIEGPGKHKSAEDSKILSNLVPNEIYSPTESKTVQQKKKRKTTTSNQSNADSVIKKVTRKLSFSDVKPLKNEDTLLEKIQADFENICPSQDNSSFKADTSSGEAEKEYVPPKANKTRKQKESSEKHLPTQSKKKANIDYSENILKGQNQNTNKVLKDQTPSQMNKNKTSSLSKKKTYPVKRSKIGGKGIKTEKSSTVKETHNKVTSLKKQCDLCKIYLDTFKMLKEHYTKMHQILKPFVCKVCGTNFASKAHVDAHIKGVHLGDRPYECLQCDAKFFHGGHLKRHVKGVHLKLRPFICALCQGCFSEKSSLKTHLRTMHQQ